MLAIMSPARNIRIFTPAGVKPDRPLFLSEAGRLADVLKGFSPWELESLLDIDSRRALEICIRYQRFDVSEPGTPALSAYNGAAFRNLNVEDFSLEDFYFAQEHLRILSALYGLLRPADGILQYRLGMGCELRIDGKDLYEFWGDRLYKELFKGGEPVINLTSAEYARLITPHLTPGDVMVTCRFLVQKPGGARGTVSTVRAARGQMARYIIKNRVTEPEGLKAFHWAGYRFIESSSDDLSYIFIQDKNLAHP